MTSEHTMSPLMPQSVIVLTHALLLVMLATFTAQAEAQICQPGRVVKIHVGDTASDAACHYNDIQSALNAVGSCPTQINVTRMHIWSNQHLTTGGKNVTLQGWGDGVTCFTLSQTCGPEVCPIPTSTQPLVTINANNTPGRVLTITGSNSTVTLRHLTISGGSVPSGDGGGIGFEGSGFLTLDTTTVSLNHAAYGGGINFDPGGQSTLRLRKNTLILNNSAAVSGGGIRVYGLYAQLLAEEPQTLIAFNTAESGFGGGVELLNGAVANIGSPGYNGLAVISFNEAVNGGGIAVLVPEELDLIESEYDTYLNLYSVNPAEPVAVSSNAAAATGGGLYLRSDAESFTLGGGYARTAKVTIHGARLNDNTAPHGAVAFLDGEVDGDITSGSELHVIDEPRGQYGCPQAPCTGMQGNATRTLNAEPVPDGALIEMRVGSVFQSERVEFRDNEAGYLLRLYTELQDGTLLITSASLQNCLVADNSFAQGVLWAPDGERWSMRVTGCTFAGNTIAAGSVMYAHNGELLLEYSIVDQPGVPTLDQADIINSPYARYLLSNDVSTLPATVDIIQGMPHYIDGPNGNYRLRHDSLGMDFAPGLAAPDELELDGQPRITDQPLVPNHFGPRDLGAYERSDPPPPEVIEADGFEDHTSS